MKVTDPCHLLVEADGPQKKLNKIISQNEGRNESSKKSCFFRYCLSCFNIKHEI